MKTMEVALTSAVTQAVGQALDLSIEYAITQTLASQRLQDTPLERPDTALAQVQTGNQYRGTHVSLHPSAHTFTHMSSRQ